MEIFDAEALRKHKKRAMYHFAQHNFLHQEIAERLFERLSLIKRSFTKALIFGFHNDVLEEMFAHSPKIQSLLKADSHFLSPESIVPYQNVGVDLVLSLLHLHWITDLPGFLWQARQMLKSDGLLLASLFGGDTLIELRDCLTQAELELKGGVSPRLSPMIGVKDMGGLMQRSQFALPVVDSDRLEITYPDLQTLLYDLRGMGETNALLDRIKTFAPRQLFKRAEEIYRARYSDQNGNLKATVEVLFVSGWAPDFSSKQPSFLGAGPFSLKTPFL